MTIPEKALGFRIQAYGMTKHSDLFTSRQLIALTTFSDLVNEAREKIKQDILETKTNDDNLPSDKEKIPMNSYSDAIATYLGLAVSRSANTLCSLAVWSQSREQTVNVFSRQTLPMNWDFPEVNPFSGAAGDLTITFSSMCKVINNLSINHQQGVVKQIDATTSKIYRESIVVSTDPPYYDNIGYADLSDFFYVWLRRSLNSIYPDLFSTLLVPKEPELVATPYRFAGSKQKAKEFFETGLNKAFERMCKMASDKYPLSIYYAFKQTETDNNGKNGNLTIASTGW